MKKYLNNSQASVRETFITSMGAFRKKPPSIGNDSEQQFMLFQRQFGVSIHENMDN